MRSTSIYVIWKDVNDRNVAGAKEVIGLFVGAWEEADELVEKLNQEDGGVIPRGLGSGYMYGYWKQEPPTITLRNYREFIEQ